MRKSWGLTKKIFSGEKTIESRWYMNRSLPWGHISSGDTVYFKDSGKSVTVSAIVDKVLQFENLRQKEVRELLSLYANGLGLSRKDVDSYYELFKNKKYCILVFLKTPKEVKPFNVDKSGFGAMSAWLTIDHLDDVAVGK